MVGIWEWSEVLVRKLFGHRVVPIIIFSLLPGRYSCNFEVYGSFESIIGCSTLSMNTLISLTTADGYIYLAHVTVGRCSNLSKQNWWIRFVIFMTKHGITERFHYIIFQILVLSMTLLVNFTLPIKVSTVLTLYMSIGSRLVYSGAV